MLQQQLSRMGVLFDLDGVLVDSEDIYTQFWSNIDNKYPTGVESFEYVIKGNTLGNILKTYFANPEVQADIIEELLLHEKNMRYELFEGVTELLTDLSLRQIRMAIVTSSNSRKMKHLLEQQPLLADLIDVIVTEEDVTFSKPHPQGYLLAAERLGLNPTQCIVIEDSIAGVVAGRRAGGAVVAISTTNSAEILSKSADMVVDSIAELNTGIIVQLISSYTNVDVLL